MFTNAKRRSSMSSKEEEKILEEYKRRIETKAKKIGTVSRERSIPPSPYLLSVAPKSRTTFSKRPQSATFRPRRNVAVKYEDKNKVVMKSKSVESQTMDEDYSSSFESSDSEVSNEKENEPDRKKTSSPLRSILRNRPSSAPAQRRNRTLDGSGDRALSKSEGKDIPSYKRQPITIRCFAYKNGGIDSTAMLTAADVKQLLEEATRKLGLNTAARRLFLPDGFEVFRAKDIPHNAEVFVSCGEPFKNPRKILNDSGSLITSQSWTAKGVVLDSERKKSRRSLSNRLRNLATKKSLRILVFENGNGCDSQEVVVGEQDSIARLLDICTSKLKRNSAARAAFGWNGNEVTNLNEVKALDSCMKSGATLLYGPLWVSSREGFNPIGAQNFVEGILWGLKQRHALAKLRSEQLDLACQGEKSQVTDVDLVIMPIEEVYANIDKVSEEMEDMKRTKEKYRQRLKSLKEMRKDQKDAGSSYTVKHMKEIKFDDPIVGKHGLRVCICENGKDNSSKQEVFINMREITRGSADRELSRARFLEYLSSWHKPIDPTGPAKSTVVRRMFDKSGNEIENVNQIENEQEIWLSYGEDFKSWQTLALQLQLEQVIAVNMDDKLFVRSSGGGAEDIKPDTKLRVTVGFPENYDSHRVQNMDVVSSPFSCDDHYLQMEDNPQVVMHPSVTVATKLEKKLGSSGESQTWVVHQNGQITSRNYPQLALAVDETRPITAMLQNGSEVEGYVLSLQKKFRGSQSQEWGFSSSGQICPLINTTMVLTHVQSNIFSTIKVKGQSTETTNLVIAVLEKLSGPSAKFQRWAMKQESVMNQWKHTKVPNPVWKKLAYSWPVLPDGNWNLDYKWPMEGTFLSSPPSLRRPTAPSVRCFKNDNSVPLKVFRNGEKNQNRFAMVVVPDLAATTLTNDKNSNNNNEMNIEKLRMNLFLEHATSLLSLSFAARRLFSATGVEVFSLRKFKRGETVYVSCGEQWQNPIMNKAIAQRRQLLAKLDDDFKKIQEFCQLRNPCDFYMSLESGPVMGSRLIVTGQKPIVTEESQKIETKNEQEEDSCSSSSSSKSEEQKKKSYHERSHDGSDAWLLKKQYPWQRQESSSPDEEKKDSFKEKKKPKSPKLRPPKHSREDLLKFIFIDGFITPEIDPGLAVGVSGANLEAISGVVEVFLCKRTIDDPLQRWEISEEGFLRLSCNHTMGLAVVLPTSKNMSGTYLEHASVVLQKLRPHTVGSANQRWRYDKDSGRIEAFHATIADKEVTAANHVSVCTHAVCGQEPLNQDGFVVEMEDTLPSNRPVVCRSCASVMRGMFTMTRVPTNWSFVCAMGSAKKYGLKLRGSFRCLNGKVDLSTYEAEPTFEHYLRVLHNLRKETSLQSINRGLNSIECTQAWRLLVRKNGEGYCTKPEIVIGSSVAGVLDQCSHKLRISSAARRLYTEDGTQILHMDQLNEWMKKVSSENNQQRRTKVTEENLRDMVEKDGANGERNANNSTEGTPDQSATEIGTQDLTRQKGRADGTKTDEELPPLPIVEVWISCGENFINPDLADKLSEENLSAQIGRNARNLSLDTQRHVIRQIHGRRRGRMNPGELIPTKDSTKPVLVSGGWAERTQEEAERLVVVHELQEKQRKRNLKSAPKLHSQVYNQPKMKRIIVRATDDDTTSVFAWGNSLLTLLEDASERLGLRRAAKVFRTQTGKKITNYEEVERDAVLYINPRRPGSSIQMKASWARARKLHGTEATNIVISNPIGSNSEVNVTPTDVLELSEL